MRIVRSLSISATSLLVAASLGRATTFTVDRTDDVAAASACQDATPNDCSLRGAIRAANMTSGADTIMLPAGTYTLAVTGRCEDAAATGDLDITDDLTITGAGAATTIIDGNGIDRVFDVWAHVSVSGVTIRNGNAGTTSCPSGIGPNGGGIYSAGAAPGTTSLTLTDVTVINNTAAHGGGIENDLLSTLNLTGVTVSGNTASVAGGGIENEASAPGATLTNVTASGNGAGTSVGITNDGDLTLNYVTISGNSLDGSGDHTITNTILANGPSGANCSGGGTLLAEDHNLDSGNTCGFTDPSDLINTNPNLGPLQDNGGPTFTQALPAGSPAIDAGGSCPPPNTDQRGVTRPVDGNGDSVAVCDLGAYEFEPGATTTTTTPGGGSTTTTTLQCAVAQTFDSISCRLTAVSATVQAQVPAGTVRDHLVALLGKASSKVQQGETALGEGSKKRAKTALAKTVGPLRKFGARLRSKAAKKAILADLRASLQASATQLRTDVLALRRSL